MDFFDFYQNLPTLRTPRLMLRRLVRADAADYFAFASDPSVTRFLRWGPHHSMVDTTAYLDGVLEAYWLGTDGPWGIVLGQAGRLIGTAHLMASDPFHRQAEVGVVLHADYWGQGLGREALQAVIQYSFTTLGLHRLQGMALVGNTPACRMMAACGMMYEGILREYALQKGMWCSFDIYAILAGEEAGQRGDDR